MFEYFLAVLIVSKLHTYCFTNMSHCLIYLLWIINLLCIHLDVHKPKFWRGHVILKPNLKLQPKCLLPQIQALLSHLMLAAYTSNIKIANTEISIHSLQKENNSTRNRAAQNYSTIQMRYQDTLTSGIACGTHPGFNQQIRCYHMNC